MLPVQDEMRLRGKRKKTKANARRGREGVEGGGDER